jgi:L-cysteine S-thiosulfotransferase
MMIKSRSYVAAALLAASGFLAEAHAQPVPAAVLDQVVKNTWKAPAEGWQSRVDQDETQRTCSETRNNPKGAAFEAILARETATLVYPADGQILGNWKDGEKVAQIGTGGQFSDKADGPRGGNCYACHQMAPKS